MNIKSKISKLVSGLLCFSMIFSNALPAYAADAVITENTIDGEDLSVDEKNLEDITVTYKQASSFFVTIPKTIVLDGWKQSTYAVKVSGDIDAEQCVYVAPVDMIAGTENIDFYMKDQASKNTKDDVVATVTHNKFHWNATEVAAGHKQADNLVSAPDLTAGAWKGIFQMEIKLETHVTHTHNYVETITKEPTCTEAGEKKYTCDCGDSYTKVIPATGHKDTDGDGVCDECGENDPNHTHSYTEKITKEPTCTEAGEKTYTCKCGDSYTEEIPAKGHSYVDGVCTDCGEKDPSHTHSYGEGVVTKEPTCTEKGEKKYTCGCGDSYTEEIPAMGHNFVDGTCTNCGKTDLYATAPTNAYSNWDYTLDETNNIITLNYYIGSETAVIVYGNYVVGGKIYKTQLKSNTNNANGATSYMFNGIARTNCKNINSIVFSESIDTSNVIDMRWMFYGCSSLSDLDLGNFDTSNVTDMGQMFAYCNSLASLDITQFNTSNVTNMSNMFLSLGRNTSLESIDLSSFDTSNVTSMNNMFSNCLFTSLDLSNFDTSNVTDMQAMFGNCSNLNNLKINGFNTGRVTNMRGMFYNCSSLGNLDLSGFDTSNVTNMNEMFYGCSSLTSLDLSSFDTSNIMKIDKMFYDCSSLESLDLSNFDTSNLTYISELFYDCSSLRSLDVSNWDTSNVTYMWRMFYGCSSLTSLDLSNFDTSKVEMMNEMFQNCSLLTNLDLSNFDTSSVTTMEAMFKNCSSLTKLDLCSFNTSKVNWMRYLFMDCSNMKTIYVTNGKWVTAKYTTDMFKNCGTSSVTYK